MFNLIAGKNNGKIPVTEIEKGIMKRREEDSYGPTASKSWLIKKSETTTKTKPEIRNKFDATSKNKVPTPITRMAADNCGASFCGKPLFVCRICSKRSTGNNFNC